MPRKTRKQKERAAASTEPVKREFSFNLQSFQQTSFEAKNQKKIEKSILFVNNTAIIQDLLKSAVFAILVFGLELVIYWRWFR